MFPVLEMIDLRLADNFDGADDPDIEQENEEQEVQTDDVLSLVPSSPERTLDDNDGRALLQNQASSSTSTESGGHQQQQPQHWVQAKTKGKTKGDGKKTQKVLPSSSSLPVHEGYGALKSPPVSNGSSDNGSNDESDDGDSAGLKTRKIKRGRMWWWPLQHYGSRWPVAYLGKL